MSATPVINEEIFLMTPNPYQTFRKHLIHDGLFVEGKEDSWRIGCHPFVLSTQQAQFLDELGQHLLAFYTSINRLYMESLKGTQPQWVHEYFDIGKPEDLLQFARMNRFKNQLPGVIRPDLIPTDSGMALTELDSVPGGIGLTGSLSRMYAQQGASVWPSPDGLIKNFSRMLKGAIKDQPLNMAIIVSDEADAYRTEMQWVARQLSQDGWKAYCVHPRDIRFTEDGLFVDQGGQDHPISLIYRFFELFDLKNIPKGELIIYSAKKGRVVVTPPYKPWMEEKLALALIHHPMLQPFWEQTLPSETLECLQTLIPPTWVLDPRPLPPTAVIPGLRYRNHAVSNWDWLGESTQKERQYVIKVSGFSELAWGSRGVSIGHDMSQQEWKNILSQTLDSFHTAPSILQTFHKGKAGVVEYYDHISGEETGMEGRLRLSPYYFVVEGKAELGGVLASICPKDKKIIHGMRDAV
ncbi:MAG: hypothetical protein O7F12_09920, partial [Nitrospirae bacterium]|nr:hypothetical protein [Nitrospirota bacterium]